MIRYPPWILSADGNEICSRYLFLSETKVFIRKYNTNANIIIGVKM